MTEHEERDEEAGEQPPVEESEAGARTGKAGKPGRGLAFLALLVALLAAAVAGWTGWQTWQERQDGGNAVQRVADLSGRVDRLGDELASLREEVATAGERARAAGEEAGQAEGAASGAAERAEAAHRSVSDLADETAGLQQRLNEQGRRIDVLAGRMDEAGGGSPALSLALAQAEHLVLAAYRILELERDPERAARAMSLAADRLRGLQAPGLTRVRETVAGELEALRGVPAVDREGLAARLAGLAGNVGDLPLRAGLGPASAAPADSAGGQEPSGGERGWWQATRAFLGEYFTVRRTDESGTALAAPGTLNLMRDVLRLSIEQARLALLRGEPGLYRQSLDRADSLLADYFAAGDPAVASARETVAELRDTDIAPPVPEVGAALEALRAVSPDDGTESS